MKRRDLIITILGCVGLYDLLTTIYGTSRIMGGGFGAIIAGVVLGAIFGGLLYYTHAIHKLHVEGFAILIKPLWFFALAYDLLTSFIGNNRFIVNTELTLMSGLQMAVLVGLTVFVSSSLPILSYVRHNAAFMSSEAKV